MLQEYGKDWRILNINCRMINLSLDYRGILARTPSANGRHQGSKIVCGGDISPSNSEPS